MTVHPDTLDLDEELDRLREEAVVTEYLMPRQAGRSTWLMLNAGHSLHHGHHCLFITPTAAQSQHLDRRLRDRPGWRGSADYLVVSESAMNRAVQAVDWKDDLHVFIDNLEQFERPGEAMDLVRQFAQRVYVTAEP